MERVAIDDVEPGDVETDRRGLSELLGTTGVAINRYRLAPGESFPAGLHAHADQEEIFLVLSGEATFETLVPREDDGTWEAGEVTVGAGEAIRFAPGEFQSGRNAVSGARPDGSEDDRSERDADLVALALGAPRDSEDVRLPLACPDCGRDDVRLAVGEDALRFVCPDCGDERVPADCPACGGEDLRVTLGEGARTVVACQGCGAEYDDPPVQDDG